MHVCFICLTAFLGDLWLQAPVASSGDNTEQTKSTKTKESTRYAVHIFQEYLFSRGKSSSFESMDAIKLNFTLADFFENVRSRHGEAYSKNSLMAIRQGLRRHLQGPPFFRNFDIVTDSRFSEANNAIKNAMRKAEIQKSKDLSPLLKNPYSPPNPKCSSSSMPKGPHQSSQFLEPF